MWLEASDVATRVGVGKPTVLKAIRNSKLRAEEALVAGRIVYLMRAHWVDQWRERMTRETNEARRRAAANKRRYRADKRRAGISSKEANYKKDG